MRKVALLEFGHLDKKGAPRVAPCSPTSGGGAPRKRRRFACENFAHWWRDAAASKMEELHWERGRARQVAHTAREHTANYIILSLSLCTYTRTHKLMCAMRPLCVNAKTPPRVIDLSPSRYDMRALVRHFGVAKIYRGRSRFWQNFQHLNFARFSVWNLRAM